MAVSDGLYRITEMGFEHHKEMEAREREQKEAVGAVLQSIIDIVGFEPGPPYDDPLFKGIYSVPRLLERVRELAR